MAGQFNAASDRVSCASAPDPAAGLTFTCWFRIDVDLDAFSTIMRLHAADGGSTTLTIGTGSDGVTVQTFSAGGAVAGAPAVVGDWYRVAYTISGTNVVLYLADETGSTAVFTGTVTPGATPTGLTIAGRSVGDADEPFAGTLAYPRLWSGTVATQAEVEAEWASAAAVRTSGLWADWPLDEDLLDDSGNARNLTAGTTAVSFVAGPPLPDAESADLAASLPALTVSAAASATSTADLAAMLPALTATAAASSTSTASATATLPALVSELAANPTATADLEASLPALSVAMGPAPDEHDVVLTASLAAQQQTTATIGVRRWTATLGAQ